MPLKKYQIIYIYFSGVGLVCFSLTRMHVLLSLSLSPILTQVCIKYIDSNILLG